MVDTVTATAVAALGLQWFRYLKYMSKSTGEPVVGATIVQKKWFDAQPPDVQQALLEASASMSDQLQVRVRKEDQQAAETLKKRGIQEFDMLAQRKEWEPVVSKLIARMTGRLYSKELLTRVYSVAHGAPPPKSMVP
jgi:TRAP-type C4-dicarboxylate transport system substrate-binding protein